MRRKGLAIVIALPIVVIAGAYAYFYRSLPTVNGSVAVEGISGTVEIVRDRNAVPHIFAPTRSDAAFGLGYVHAQDRLWQMEFQRRIGHGRLSEVLGSAAVPQDRFLRTVGFGRAARSAWDRLPADARALIDSYCAGVNAFIAGHHGSRLPPEFTLLGFEPEPWTGADVLAWVKMMAWDLSANYSMELLRQDIVARVGVDRMKQLMMPPSADALSILTSDLIESWTPPSATKSTARDVPPTDHANIASPRNPEAPTLNALLWPGLAEGMGSNSWVVDGSMTRSGKPLLANDPHLATKVPSLWYLAHMHFGDEDLIGATLPGIPAVAIGRNSHIAWGETNVAADVEDLFIEHLDPSGRFADFHGVQEPLRIITETIKVKSAAPITVDVRVTRHGPLVSDAINAINAASPATASRPPLQPLAFRWTALDEEDLTVQAFFKLNVAHDWHAFTDALKDFVVPSQNFVYADSDGHIGYYAPGRIPIRASGDGTLPVPGWTGDAEWTGFIPFEQLPHAFDPPQHFLVAANNSPAPASYSHFISTEYPEPYRAQRINELLQGRKDLTPADFRGIQSDTKSLNAAELLPMLLARAHPQSELEREAVDRLKRWDLNMRGDSPAAAIYEAWFLRLAPALAGDDLGDDVLKTYQKRFSSISRFVSAVLSTNGSRWCDNVTTPAPESCEDTVMRALREALAALTSRLGPDLRRWRWDSVHLVSFPHQGLDSVTGLHWLLSRSVPNGGDFSTVNVGAVNPDQGFGETDIPGYRQIVDLSSRNDSRFLDAVGQSGHVLSHFYDDALDDWQGVRHRPMLIDRAAIEHRALGTLRLVQRR